jgi:hypothetical protein
MSVMYRVTHMMCEQSCRTACFRNSLRSKKKSYVEIMPVCDLVWAIKPIVFLVILSITNKLQRYTVFFITVNVLHVSGGFSAHHQELRNCTHTASGGWVSCNSPTPAVAANKLDIYPMLCVQCLSSWWWVEKSPETCRALTVIKNIV